MKAEALSGWMVVSGWSCSTDGLYRGSQKWNTFSASYHW